VTGRLRTVRVSLRTRLTLIYGLLFFVTAAALVAVTYLLTAQAITDKFTIAIPRSVSGLGGSPLPGVQPGPELPGSLMVLRRQVTAQLEQQQHEVMMQLLRSSTLAVLALGLLAVVLGYLVAGRMLRPLQTVTATARRLSESTLHERIALSGPDDEIKELSDTFDGMLDRLHRAFDAQRRFVANASHELRTPLAINRTVLEVAVASPRSPEETKALGRTLLDNTARHERMIEGLLLLAQSERELSDYTPIDVRDVAEAALEQLRGPAERAGVTITSGLASAGTAGDPVLVERCVVNLIENAIKYNVTDGQVWVHAGREDRWAFVRVENTGPLVPPYQIEALFEPFRRLRADRVGSAKGAGLGLSIVRAVVRAHHGTIETLPRSGGGLVITVRFPVAA
jgi:signal transduction histidine kinase